MRDLKYKLRTAGGKKSDTIGIAYKEELVSWKMFKHLLFFGLLFSCHPLAKCQPKITHGPGFLSTNGIFYGDASAKIYQELTFQGLESDGYSSGQEKCKIKSLLRKMKNRIAKRLCLSRNQSFEDEYPLKYRRQESDSSSSPYMTNGGIGTPKRRVQGMSNWRPGVGGMGKEPSQVIGFGSNDSDADSPKLGGFGGTTADKKRKTGGRTEPGTDKDDNLAKLGGKPPLGGNNASTKGGNGGQNGATLKSGDFFQGNLDALNEYRAKHGVPPLMKYPQITIHHPCKNKDRGSTDGDNRSGCGNFHQENLDAHNEYRKKHGVPPLRLNDEISEISQRWAEHLASLDSIYTIYHSDGNKFRKGWGENIHARVNGHKETGHNSVHAWYREINNYDFRTGTSTNGKPIGHLTQLLWDTSEELGVGYAFSSDGSIFVVCHYNPSGNFIGENMMHVPPIGGFSGKYLQIQN